MAILILIFTFSQTYSMGICVSREVSYPGLSDHHQRHQHPQGVAGLKPEEIDHEPEHVTPKGVVTSMPFIELGVRENNLLNFMIF